MSIIIIFIHLCSRESAMAWCVDCAHAAQSWSRHGSIHGSGRVRSGRVRSSILFELANIEFVVLLCSCIIVTILRIHWLFPLANVFFVIKFCVTVSRNDPLNVYFSLRSYD